MATALEKLMRANRWRIRTGKAGTTEIDGFNGAFLIPLEGEMYHVMISDGMGWKHVSIVNAQRKVLPPWSVMTRVKDLFFADDEWCCQFFPAKDDYVNDLPWCLHLWMPLDVELPHPGIALV
jgi:hypothetical protein